MFMKGKESLVYIIIIIIISTLSARAVNNMIMTTVPSFAKYELGMNNLYVGLLASSLSMTTLISTVFINPFLSSPKRRMAFILSTISIIFLLILYYFSSKVTIWIITIITGLVYGFIMPNLITFASIAKDKKNAERLLNIYSMSLSLSLVIGPLLETFLLERYSYRDIFILFLPLAIPLAFLSKNVKFPETTKEVRSFSVLKNHGLTAAIISITLYNIPFAIISSFIVIYTKELFNVANFEAYSVFLPFFSLSFLTRFIMALRPFKDLRTPMALSILLTAIGIIIVSIAPNFTTLLL